MNKQELAKKMPIIGYGHTFNNEKDRDSYAIYMREKRQRNTMRKKSMTDQEKNDAEVRSNFKKDASYLKSKYTNIK